MHAVKHHDMKTYGGNGGVGSRILNLMVNKIALLPSRPVRRYSRYLVVIRLDREEAVEKIYPLPIIELTFLGLQVSSLITIMTKV